MDFTEDVAKVKELLDKSTDILIATHEHPTADSIGSSLALMLGLADLGKKVTLICPDPMTVGLSNFVGVDKIKTELSKKNFIISLDYAEGSIEKVSYNIEGDKFNLVIEPRDGFPPFTEDKIHYTNAGSAAQLIFIVDTIHLGGLKKLYEDDKELYVGHPIVNIDRHPNNNHYGQVNVIDAGAATTAEITAKLLSGLEVNLTPDIATNLMNAIYLATNNFTSFILTPSAFEVAAVCLKAGGKRFSITPSEEVPGGTETAVTPPPSVVHTQPQKPRFQTSQNHGGTQIKYPAQPLSAAPQAKQVSSPVSPASQPAPAGTPAPEDWLKPKIFKSSNNI